jgi:proton glutamate symport protein
VVLLHSNNSSQTTYYFPGPSETIMNLSTLILIALGLGAVFGTLLNTVFPAGIAPLDQYLLDPVGQAFLRLIQFVVVPIVFSSLILGLTRIQSAAQVGRYVVKLLTSYLITSFIALCLGITIALLLKPGMGMAELPLSATASGTPTPSLIDWLVSLIPINPLAALSSGNLLQVIFSHWYSVSKRTSKTIYRISRKYLHHQ